MSKMQQRMPGRGIPSAALGASAATMEQAPKQTKLSAAMGSVVRGEYVELPVYGRVWIHLLGHAAASEIESGVFQEMARLRMESNATTMDLERKVRILAACVRDPDCHDEPFGSFDEWNQQEDDLIYSSYLYYDDVRERLDPLGSLGMTLSEETFLAVQEAFKKKDAMALLSFGTRVLASWLRSGAVQLSTSPTPSSMNTPSSSESPSSSETANQEQGTL